MRQQRIWRSSKFQPHEMKITPLVSTTISTVTFLPCFLKRTCFFSTALMSDMIDG